MAREESEENIYRRLNGEDARIAGTIARLMKGLRKHKGDFLAFDKLKQWLQYDSRRVSQPTTSLRQTRACVVLGDVVSLSHARTSYRVNRPLHS